MLFGLADSAHDYVPSVFWTWPFIAILGCIAVLPLLHRTHYWWEENRNKLLIAGILSAFTLLYYGCRDYGLELHHGPDAAHAADGQVEHGNESSDAEAQNLHEDGLSGHATENGHHDDSHAHAEHHRTQPGLATVLAVLDHAVLMEYVPFLTLLFALYVIAGGIVIRGDIRGTPLTNTTILGIGGALASFIGTTGASMILIRVLLRANLDRKSVVHTVVFFIFIVSNIGGSLLPIGDPPLFLGYLKGVPFFWTFGLWKPWLFLLVVLLAIYFIWDTVVYRRENPATLDPDSHNKPLSVVGLLNLVWVGGVIFAVVTLDPSKPFMGTEWHPWPYLREGVQFAMVALAVVTTPGAYRRENNFNLTAIGEVACVFIGIFITMQVPLEILNARGAELGLTKPWQFFWATGILSSFLDNAPTYVVFFQTAQTLPMQSGHELSLVGGGNISEPLLVAISCGAVFMGANSYIGNGPNFMVRTIAEQSGVRMPSFFGYMIYSTLILLPLFVIVTFIFMR